MRIALYCKSCGHTCGLGREGKPGGFRWIKKCGRCVESELRKQAEVRRLEELWSVRECDAPDCGVTFVPARGGQRFCSDRCRKRTHRRAKAAAVAAG